MFSGSAASRAFFFFFLAVLAASVAPSSPASASTLSAPSASSFVASVSAPSAWASSPDPVSFVSLTAPLYTTDRGEANAHHQQFEAHPPAKFGFWRGFREDQVLGAPGHRHRSVLSYVSIGPQRKRSQSPKSAGGGADRDKAG